MCISPDSTVIFPKSETAMLSRPTGSKGVKGWAYRDPGGQGVGLLGPRGQGGRPNRSQGVKG